MSIVTDSRIDSPIRVLICDDHHLVREGLARILEVEEDIEVIGQAADGHIAVEMVEEGLPDVVVMDLSMPRGGGVEAIKRIRSSAPNTRVLILTGSDNESDLFSAIRAGAAGYLLKSASGDEIVAAIRVASKGESALSAEIAERLIDEFRASAAGTFSTGPRLTDREIEVLGLVGRGMSTRSIGRELGISETTVKAHVQNTLEKLQLHTRLEAVLYAVRNRMIDITETDRTRI